MSNRLGNALKVTVFGQSHAPSIGAVIEGLPAGLALDMAAISDFMGRRAPGRSDLTTPRREADSPRVIAGLNDRGLTCGSPLCVVIDNGDTRSRDYDQFKRVPRPGHADYPSRIKFGDGWDVRGGGQFSGRLTAPLCFAGAIALQMLEKKGVTLWGHLLSVGDACDRPFDPVNTDAAVLHMLREKPFPALDDAAGQAMRDQVRAAQAESDSVGGIVELCAVGLPAGLGDPMFEGLENRVAAALFGVPAVKGVEFGAGFAAARMRGSQHNDAYRLGANGEVSTATNHAGGALGGLTSGMPLIARAAIKPTSSIGRPQQSVDLEQMREVELAVEGRHDPCIALRAWVPAIAVVALALADLMTEEGLLR